MSEFDGIIREFNVAVDYFHPTTFKCSAFFLSHCHTDHESGLSGSESSFLGHLEQPGVFLYCTEITAHFLTSRHPAYARLNDKIVPLLPSVPVQVPVRDLEGGDGCQQITVSAIPAGHCPGSAMFLFEGKEMTVLYTGDLRVMRGDIEKFRPLHGAGRVIKTIDTLYLDTTFFNPSFWKFPARDESVRNTCNVINNWISNGPRHNICLSLPAWTGTEYLFAHVANRFKMKIHVLPELFSILKFIPEVEDAVTDEFSGTQIHAVYKKNFYKIKERLGGKFLKKIELSAAGYRNTRDSKEVMWCRDVDSNNTTYVCYSSHCSFSELEDIICHLKPRKVFPCVKPFYSSKKQVKDLMQELGVRQVDLSIFSDVYYSDSECDDGGQVAGQTEVLYQNRVLTAACTTDNKIRQPPVLEKLIDSPPPKRRHLQLTLS